MRSVPTRRAAAESGAPYSLLPAWHRGRNFDNDARRSAGLGRGAQEAGSEEGALDEQHQAHKQDGQRRAPDHSGLPPGAPEPYEHRQGDGDYEGLPELDPDIEPEEGEQQVVAGKAELAQSRREAEAVNEPEAEAHEPAA